MYTTFFGPVKPDDTLSFLVACEAGDPGTIYKLLKKRPSLAHYRVKATDIRAAKLGYGEGATGLMLAAERGHRYAVNALLRSNADPNYGETGDPAESLNHPLIRACFNGHSSCVNELLKAGADANAVSAFGTPLELLALRAGAEPSEAYALLFLHSKVPIRLRSRKEMQQQHTTADIQTILRNMVQIQAAMERAGARAKATFQSLSRRRRSSGASSTRRKKKGGVRMTLN